MPTLSPHTASTHNKGHTQPTTLTARALHAYGCLLPPTNNQPTNNNKQQEP